MSNKLFVGNLAWSVTSEKLHEVFSSFGPLVEAKVLTDHQTGRSRGFGFVTFRNEEDADRATAEMHNKEIEGRPIRCDNTQQPNRKERPERHHREPKEGRQSESRPRREQPRREQPRRDENRSARPNYDMYQVSDIMPNPDKGGRGNRRDNRRKDRNHDDDDRW